MDESNGKGYGCFVMFVSAVSFIFSVIALLRWDHKYCTISAVETVIASLSALITFVVAWQIWQVIDTKNIITRMKEQVDAEKNERETSFKQYSEQLSLFTFAANCVNDAIMMQTELHHIIHNNLISSREKTGYNVAYSYLLRGLRDAVKANVPESERLIDICLDNMNCCLNSAEVLKEQYEKYAAFGPDLGAECDAVYNVIKDEYSKRLNRRQISILDKLQERQKKLMSKNL